MSTLAVSALLTACAGSPRTPSGNGAQPVDVNAYIPMVDSFVVLLDSSASMSDDDSESSKFQIALNSVASFNQAVPDIDFESGLVLFGKGVGNCTGHSMANKIYGISPYDSGDFARALADIDCSGGGTPIEDAIALTTSSLGESAGKIAVFIFSDFMWEDADAVRDAVSNLNEQHGDRLCLHAVQVGGHRQNDRLINDITSVTDCGSLVAASDIASPIAMTSYAAKTLMSPRQSTEVIQYEQQTFSATTLFKLDSATLSDAGREELRELAAYINGHGSTVGDIQVTGHTCDLGSEGYNQRLSIQRARSVAAYLALQGVPENLMTVDGMGERKPITSNANEAGRAQNRRVEVRIGTGGS